jgi:hypothetical protein
MRPSLSSYGSRGLTMSELPIQNPLSSPVHLSLTTPPLHLTFSPPAQRLSRIQVTGPNPGSHVAYRQRRLQSTANTAAENDDEDEDEREDVVKRIRTILGPTFGSSKAPTVAKGSTEQDHDEEENMLCYPGVAFGVQKTRSGMRGIPFFFYSSSYHAN